MHLTKHKIKKIKQKVGIVIRKVILPIIHISEILGIVIALLTLWEMDQERKMAYYPDLIIQGGMYIANAEIDYKTDMIYGETFAMALDSKENFASITISNLGEYSAKNCELVWNEKNLQKNISSLKTKGNLDVYETGFSFEISKNAKLLNVIEENSLEPEVCDYILPITQYSYPIEIKVPVPYLEIIDLYSLSKEYNQKVSGFYEEKNDEYNIFFKFLLRYQDIHGNEYVKKYRIDVVSEGPIRGYYKLNVVEEL